MKNYTVSRYNENIWMTSKILQDIVKFAYIVNAYNSFASTYFSRERGEKPQVSYLYRLKNSREPVHKI